MDKALILLNRVLPEWPNNWPTAVLIWFFVLVGSSLAGGVVLLLFPTAPQPLFANIVAGVAAWFCLWLDERTWPRFISAYSAGAFCYGWGMFFVNDHLVLITPQWVEPVLFMCVGAVMTFFSPSKLADELG